MHITKALIFVMLPTLAACTKTSTDLPHSASQGDNGAPPAIRIDGSSTLFPLVEGAAERFEKTSQNIDVLVSISGTGGGLKKLCAGATDLANASRPIKLTEMDLCKKSGAEYVELAVAYDGLAIVINPENTWATDITTAELKTLWEPEAQGKVTTWRQVRASWPDSPIRLYGPGADSGTYDYFTQAIVHKEHSSRGDYVSSEDDNAIVQGVSNERFALGMFGYAYYLENKHKLRLLPVDDGNDQNGKGPIAPSVETVTDGTYQPLSRPLFLYVAKKALDRPAVLGFIDLLLEQAAPLVKAAGFVPLPPLAYQLAKNRVSTRRVGTVFGGSGSLVGITVEDLVQRQKAPPGN